MYESYYRQTPWYTELWQGWLDMFRGDWPEVAIGVILGFLGLAVALLILYGVLRALDRWFTPKQEGGGRLVRKWVREGYWTEEGYTEYEWGFGWSGGKYSYGYHPVTKYRKVWVPPQPKAEVMLIDGDIREEFDIDDSVYRSLRADHPLRITFQRGRLSNIVYINSFARA